MVLEIWHFDTNYKFLTPFLAIYLAELLSMQGKQHLALFAKLAVYRWPWLGELSQKCRPHTGSSTANSTRTWGAV